MTHCDFFLIRLYYFVFDSNNSGSHLTTIRITDKELFYLSKFNPQKWEDDLWQSFSLFNLKFVQVSSLSLSHQ